MKDVALHHARTVIHYREAVRDASYSAGMHEDQSRTPQKAISKRYYFYAEPFTPEVKWRVGRPYITIKTLLEKDTGLSGSHLLAAMEDRASWLENFVNVSPSSDGWIKSSNIYFYRIREEGGPPPTVHLGTDDVT